MWDNIQVYTKVFKSNYIIGKCSIDCIIYYDLLAFK